MSLIYYVIDLETNGLSSLIHEPCEISIIRCSDKVQVTKNIICKYPEKSSLDALRITGKTMNDLRNGDTLEYVVNLCDKFLNEDGKTPAHRVIIGHNIISFDKKFLHKMWSEYNKRFPADLYLDTIQLIRAYTKNLDIKTKVNLNASCDLMKIKKYSSAHSAKSDTRNTYLLWKSLIEKVDYIRFIKNYPHILNSNIEDYDLTELE